MKLSELLGRLFGVRRRSARGVGVDHRERETAAIEDDEDLDPFDPFPEPVRLEIGDVFDLHTIPPREVRAVVEEYLSEARRAGFRQVRIIHGKGVGVQRETVRSVLARTPFIEHFTDAPPEAGGWGATIAQLRADDVNE
ncbi:MAG TPA: Smr/MutS family protein [Pyrinomonadaceae bacterium]|jgi:dsDNA-specific endonuclease/ATPase MutS2